MRIEKYMSGKRLLVKQMIQNSLRRYMIMRRGSSPVGCFKGDRVSNVHLHFFHSPKPICIKNGWMRF